MIKAYKKELKGYDYNEIRLFNEETGEFTSYMQDKKMGFIFSIYNTIVFEMGYKSIKECLKELKSRGFLGNEVDYKEQKESERLGYIKLGVFRIKRAGRINTTDFEDVYNKLANYGMGLCDAQNCITAAYIHEFENKKEVVTC